MIRFKRLWLLLFIPISILFSILSACYPVFSEWYTIHVYSYLSRAGNFITSLLPFSLAELLVILIPFALLFYFIFFMIKMIRKKTERKQLLLKLTANMLCCSSVLFFIFMISCGINYNRFTFAEVCGLTIKESSKSELTDLCIELAKETSKLRLNVDEDANGVMMLSFPDIPSLGVMARDSYDLLSGSYPTLTAGYGIPKPVKLSRLMSYCDIAGIFFPFTFEANVNIDIPAYSIPSTMCHELTHLRGYMREDEANFIAFLACRESLDADLQYSGSMLAFVQANNALFSVDSQLAGEIYNSLGDGVKRDFAFNSTYWKQFEGPMAKVANQVNDTYLKANRQEDGVQSYGRMVDLLLAERRSRQ